MNFRNKKIIIASSIVTTLVLFVSVAFAALASNLNISFGNVTQNALSWNVGFKGSSATATQDGTSSTGLSCGTATVAPSTVTISDSTLSKPGDKCTYALTIQNSGDIAANLSSIVATEPTGNTCTITNNSTMVCGKITYQLQTTTGGTLTTGITINKKEMYNIKLVVTYTGEELSSTGLTQSNAKFTLTYTQAENRSGTAPEGIEMPKKCRRATTLHTETCDKSAGGCYDAGYYSGGSKNTTTITYGSLGTSGTLNSGDAFDCDVNGDGTYDAETERFYYVSGLDGDSTSEYATLIYYTNVSDGSPNNTAHFTYGSNGRNYEGPVIASAQLPTTGETQWKNVGLSNQTRQIYAQNNETLTSGGALPQFTYTDRAARLLSYKEVNAGCGISVGIETAGALDSCEYLLEHTYYSTSDSSVNEFFWWLETPRRYSSDEVCVVQTNYRRISSSSTSYARGVRPAIEVLKTDIDY